MNEEENTLSLTKEGDNHAIQDSIGISTGDSDAAGMGVFNVIESIPQYRLWVKENPETLRRIKEVRQAAYL